MKFLAYFIMSKLLLMSAVVHASDITIINVGNRQSPTAVFGLAFKNAIPGESQWVQANNCRDAQKTFNNTKNAVMIYSSSVDFRERANGDRCNQAPLTVQNTLLISSLHVKICRKPNSQKKLTDPGSRLGIASVIATKKHEKEWNTNGFTVKFVPYGGSTGVVQAVINGEIDWGWIGESTSSQFEKQGTLDCPYSTDPKSPGFLGKHMPQLTLPDFEIVTAVYTNSTDPTTLAQLQKAIKNPEFQNWLINSQNPSITDITVKDVEKVNRYVDRMVNSWGDK
jgi:hypothetical protein